MNSEELELITDTARRLLVGGNRYALVDELVGAGIADEVHTDEAVLAALATVQGAERASSTLLSLVLAGPAFEATWTAVVPPPGTRTAPGRRDGDDLVVDGAAINPHGAGPYLVHTEDDALLVPSDALTTRSVAGLDPDLGLHVVTGTVPLAACVHAGAPDWEHAQIRALRALSHELIALAHRALDRAIEHVTQRQQFGAPIGVFQAVQHRLVDAHTALAAARAVVESTRGSGDLVAALAAKAWAGRAAHGAVDAAQQFSGAMGFTWEFGLHELVRRIQVVDSLFGDAEAAATDIGALLVRRAEVPRLAPLG